MSRSPPHLPTTVLKVRAEALTEARCIQYRRCSQYHNSKLCFLKAVSLVNDCHCGNGGQTYISRAREELEEPPNAWVKLTGQFRGYFLEDLLQLCLLDTFH